MAGSATSTSLPIKGSSERFAVRRIYCVGRNYADHVREIGGDPSREAPFFFAKPGDAVVQNGGEVPYPPRTGNLHHEVELVVAIGRGGAQIGVADALDHVFGYAVGNDLTRRDLQAQQRDRGQPWEISKGFDHSAPLTAIHPVSLVGNPPTANIWLEVNGAKRQAASLSQMVWSVAEIVAELSTFFRLEPGDLIFTGTPAGVGPLKPGDRIRAGIDGFDVLEHRIV
ncbi:MAG: fumarylacetoacetate hydrolase family protein [Steroidobacteraceae bacterium]